MNAVKAMTSCGKLDCESIGILFVYRTLKKDLFLFLLQNKIKATRKL